MVENMKTGVMLVCLVNVVRGVVDVFAKFARLRGYKVLYFRDKKQPVALKEEISEKGVSDNRMSLLKVQLIFVRFHSC